MSTFLFYLVHTDVWDPSNIPNISDARLFIIFIDDCTRVTQAYLLKQKSKVNHVVPQFLCMVKNQFDMIIKRIWSDNVKDYFSHNLNSLCQNEGIIHESSCFKTPQQNDIAERKKQTFVKPNTCYDISKVPKKYWGETILTASYLINHLSSCFLASKTPMKVLSSFYPNVSTDKIEYFVIINFL